MLANSKKRKENPGDSRRRKKEDSRRRGNPVIYNLLTINGDQKQDLYIFLTYLSREDHSTKSL